MNLFSVLENQTIITASNAGSNSQTAEEIAREQAEEQQNDFLNILLTQLSNQNPLDPLDTEEFSAQLTRFSILEQGIQTNEHLAVTNSLLESGVQSANLSYIGKEVEVETNASVVQNGQATWSYLVEGNATDVKLTITDQSGNRIDEVDGSIGTGVQTINFDASQYGLEEGQQLYLSVNASGANDTKLNSQTAVIVKVDGVWTDGAEMFLTAGEISFRTRDIQKIINETPNETQDNNTNS